MAEERFQQEAAAIEQRRIATETTLRQEAEERATKAAAAAEEHQKRRDNEAVIALERLKTGQLISFRFTIHCDTRLRLCNTLLIYVTPS